MDFDFSPEQYTMRDEARRFLDEQCPPSHVRGVLDDPAAWSSELWMRMAGLGWTALAFPEDCGGLGSSFLDLVLVLGELGRALAPVPFLSSIVGAGHAILAHGSAEQRRRLIPGIASGERIGTLVPPGSPVTATRDGAGGAWRLDGEARHVLDAPAANLVIVAAQDRWFAVQDVRAQAQTGLDLTRPIGTVTFDGTRAEALEAPGVLPGLTFAVAGCAAQMIGTGQKILDATVEYAKVREQFGRPIGSFQAIKHRCADMATDVEAARSAAYYACWAASAGADDAEMAASVAKSFCSEALARVAGEGVQVHGGIAFTWEHDMHLYLRRIKSDQALFGDAAHHRERIASLAGL